MANPALDPDSIPLIVPKPPNSQAATDAYSLLRSSYQAFIEILNVAEGGALKDSPGDRIAAAVDAMDYPLPREAKAGIRKAIAVHQREWFVECLKGRPEIREMIQDAGRTVEDGKFTFHASVALAFDLDEMRWREGLETAVSPHLPADADSEAAITALWRALASVRQRGEALRRGLLMAVVAAFEEFLAACAEDAIEQWPSLLRSSSRAFTSLDILNASSVSELRAEIASDFLARLGRSGFSGYAKFFASLLNVDINAARETLERRNVVVHHGSRVSRQYLDAMAAKEDLAFKEGDEIPVSRAYLVKAMSDLSELARDLARRISAGPDMPSQEDAASGIRITDM